MGEACPCPLVGGARSWPLVGRATSSVVSRGGYGFRNSFGGLPAKMDMSSHSVPYCPEVFLHWNLTHRLLGGSRSWYQKDSLQES